jgi:RecB family endonuclease NucS
MVIARCEVDYSGRLDAHLPPATRLLLVKADGSVLVHSDGGSYKPLNWMSPPCRLTETVDVADGIAAEWRVENTAGELLRITLLEVRSDTSVDLGTDPGLTKDGVELHLQRLLAEQTDRLGLGWRLVRREYPTAIGPVDILCRQAPHSEPVPGRGPARVDAGPVTSIDDLEPVGEDVVAPAVRGVAQGARHLAVEIKRRATIDAVEQLTRYLDLLNRDPFLRPVRGTLAAQSITQQARTLAEDRGIRCLVLDYDEMRGIDNAEERLF